MRLWRAGIGVLLAAGLLLPDAGPARAEPAAAEVPRPGLKPLLLEPLVWDEACEPAHTRVELPIGGMSANMREAWGLPRTADPARWSPGAVLLLGRAYEAGEMGMPDAAEAARLYCLLLRHRGSHMAALLLSRLHARGEGVAFSPALADHFARIAGIALEPDRGLERLLHSLRGNGTAAADLAVLDQLREARQWWRAMTATSVRPLHRRVRQYIAGTGTPRSQLLTDELYDILVEKVLTGRDNGAILVAYIRYKMGVADGAASLSESEVDWLQMIAYEAAADRKYPPAQAMIGRFYLTGEVFPRSDLLAFMWLSAAKASGEEVATELAAVQHRVPAADARLGREFLAMDILPPIVSRRENVQEFRALLAH